jgi:alkylation response protein AidB-like acyl-CoA dehydrogenase
MEFDYSAKTRRYLESLGGFMDEHVYPAEQTYCEQLNSQPSRWQSPPIMETLKAAARRAGLWNLFLPDSEYGAGRTNAEYAPLCETMGRSPMPGTTAVYRTFGSDAIAGAGSRIAPGLLPYTRPGARCVTRPRRDLVRVLTGLLDKPYVVTGFWGGPGCPSSRSGELAPGFTAAVLSVAPACGFRGSPA